MCLFLSCVFSVQTLHPEFCHTLFSINFLRQSGVPMVQKSKSILCWLAGFLRPVYTACSYLSSRMLQYQSIKSRLTESVSVQIYTFPLTLLTQRNSIALVKLLLFCIDKCLLNTWYYMKNLRDKFNKCKKKYNIYVYTFEIRIFL